MHLVWIQPWLKILSKMKFHYFLILRQRLSYDWNVQIMICHMPYTLHEMLWEDLEKQCNSDCSLLAVTATVLLLLLASRTLGWGIGQKLQCCSGTLKLGWGTGEWARCCSGALKQGSGTGEKLQCCSGELKLPALWLKSKTQGLTMETERREELQIPKSSFVHLYLRHKPI